MGYAQISPREAAIAVLMWLVLGAAAILLHEERIRFIRQERNSDIYTDKREFQQKAAVYLAASLAALAMFIIAGWGVALTTAGGYIVSLDEKNTARLLAVCLVGSLLVLSLVVPLWIYLRHKAIKKASTNQSEQA